MSHQFRSTTPFTVEYIVYFHYYVVHGDLWSIVADTTAKE